MWYLKYLNTINEFFENVKVQHNLDGHELWIASFHNRTTNGKKGIVKKLLPKIKRIVELNIFDTKTTKIGLKTECNCRLYDNICIFNGNNFYRIVPNNNWGQSELYLNDKVIAKERDFDSILKDLVKLVKE